MDKIFSLMVLGVVLIVFFFGCTFQAETACPDTSELAFHNVSADKAVYHSSENMILSMVVHSASDIKDVKVSASGIKGKFNQEKLVNLSKGDNEVTFSYTLPKCNVCGGIKEGNYTLSCSVSYKNISIEDSTTIDIRQ